MQKKRLSPVDKYQYFGLVREQIPLKLEQQMGEKCICPGCRVKSAGRWSRDLIATREGKLQAASLFSSKEFQGICIRKSPQRSATLAAPWSRLRGHPWRAALPLPGARTARNSPQTVTASIFWTDAAREDSEKQPSGMSCVLKFKGERKSENQG